jgi:hypothetical protein
MEIKNTRVDLSKNLGLYFINVLYLMLFISWRQIKLKTYEKDQCDYESILVE